MSDIDLAQTYAAAAEAHLAKGQHADAIEACQKGENALAEEKPVSDDFDSLAEIEGHLDRLRQTAERLQPEPIDPLADSAEFEGALQRRLTPASARTSWLPLNQSPAGNLEQVREEPLALTDGLEVTTWIRREESGETTFRKVTLSPAREQWFQQIPPGPHNNDREPEVTVALDQT